MISAMMMILLCSLRGRVASRRTVILNCFFSNSAPTSSPPFARLFTPATSLTVTVVNLCKISTNVLSHFKRCTWAENVNQRPLSLREACLFEVYRLVEFYPPLEPYLEIEKLFRSLRVLPRCEELSQPLLVKRASHDSTVKRQQRKGGELLFFLLRDNTEPALARASGTWFRRRKRKQYRYVRTEPRALLISVCTTGRLGSDLEAVNTNKSILRTRESPIAIQHTNYHSTEFQCDYTVLYAQSDRPCAFAITLS